MRKPRDYDAELKALADKAKQLKCRKQSQLGELVIATGADELSAEELAGALLAAVATTDSATREAWRKRGAAFFRGTARGAGNSTGGGQGRAAPEQGAAQSAHGTSGAA
ncbi:conjugal transfer protein TraD [Sphingosinithalassobacter portus]|uniref:conjugal transfer protein TraD n=1 Tax=Stakelama portus TaxID=2676234 RepID=UPI000D6E1DEE|nr:conjugal transfer protein TraD [Sphingosinithalassobacter portus]